MISELPPNLLELPQIPTQVETQWKKIVADDNLAAFLKKAAKKHSVQDLSDYIANWRGFADNHDFAEDWEKLRYLTACAIGNIDSETAGSARTYKNYFQQEELPCEVLLVASTKGICKLELTLVPSGNGSVYQHPGAVFSRINLQDDFKAAIETAWKAAGKLGKRSKSYDGIWRVIETDLPRDVELSGSSAGGAAALGYHRLLNSQRNDGRVIVLAAISENGELSSVESIEEKVIGIASYNEQCRLDEIDTIVMATDENQRTAADAIKSKRITLLNCSQLTDLVGVYSQLAKDIINYCDIVVANLDETNWRRADGKPVSLQSIAVPVIAELKDPSSTGSEQDKTEDDSSLTRSSNPAISELREQNNVENAKPWANIFPPEKGNLVMIKAGPGYGKTAHTKLETIKAAKVLKSKIESRSETFTDISNIPIWLPVIRFAEAGKDDPTDAIQEGIKREYAGFRSSDYFEEWLRDKVKNCSTIYLDALDESGHNLSLRPKLGAMKEWGSICCVTSRLKERDLFEVTTRDFVEYELAGFRGGYPTDEIELEIKAFVDRWFGVGSEKGKKLLEIFKGNSTFHELCRSPLLLTFTCLVFDESGLEDVKSSTQLYEQIVTYLIRQNAETADFERIGNTAFNVSQTTQHFTEAWKLLPFLAAKLLETEIGSNDNVRNRFSSQQLESFIPQKDPTYRSASVIDWLSRKYLIANAGITGIQQYYSFAHRSLLEFLAAKYFLEQEGWLECINLKLRDRGKNSIAWSALLPHLAGMTDDIVPVIEMLKAIIRDDELKENRRSYVSTLLSCLLESKGLIDGELRDEVFDILTIGIDDEQARQKGNERSEWDALVNKYGLLQTVQAAGKHYQRDADHISRFRNQMELWAKRRGNFNEDEIENQQKSLADLESEGNLPPPEHWGLLWASVQLDKKKFDPREARHLANESEAVRALAARALVARTRDKRNNEVDNASFSRRRTEVAKLLLARLSSSNEQSYYAKGRILSALGALDANDSGIGKEIERYAEAGNPLRTQALYALGNIKNYKNAAVFREAIDDPEDGIRSTAISGLGRSRKPEDFEIIVEKLKDSSESTRVRKTAAWALGEYGTKEAIAPLIEMASGADEQVAEMAGRSLLKCRIDTGLLRENVKNYPTKKNSHF